MTGMFAGKTWWVTGASSGIGEALALALAERGAALILSGRNVEALEAVGARCGEHLILPFETTDLDRLPALVQQAQDWRGGIDGLVNNAGISQRSLAAETDFSVYRRIIDVDLMAPIALTQAVLPGMIAAGGGRIVAISSIAGIIGAALRTAYSAAKAGLLAYNDSLRAEVAHQGVQVLVVCPGSIRTNVSRNALAADGSRRGASDAAIDNGMDPAEAVARIVAAIEAGTRELIIAEGGEAYATALRRSDPEQLFDMMAQTVAAGYAKQMAEDAAAANH